MGTVLSVLEAILETIKIMRAYSYLRKQIPKKNGMIIRDEIMDKAKIDILENDDTMRKAVHANNNEPIAKNRLYVDFETVRQISLLTLTIEELPSYFGFIRIPDNYELTKDYSYVFEKPTVRSHIIKKPGVRYLSSKRFYTCVDFLQKEALINERERKCDDLLNRVVERLVDVNFLQNLLDDLQDDPYETNEAMAESLFRYFRFGAGITSGQKFKFSLDD